MQKKRAIQENILGVANNIMVRIITPAWAYWLPIEG